MNLERSMVKDDLNGLMVLNIPESSITIIFMVTAHIFGLTRENTLETGSITKWKEEAHSLGRMEEFMKENTETIRKKVMVYSNGLMVDATEEHGKVGSNTVKACIRLPINLKKKVSGKKENESNGSL